MMHHNLPKARGTFAKVVPVPSRGVYQFVIEVDDGQANAALDALGGLPAGGDARWVSIALLEPEGNRSESQGNRRVEGDFAAEGNRPAPKDKRPWHERPASQQAGILCADPEFQRWLSRRQDWTWGAALTAAKEAEDWTEFAAIIVRQLCAVTSRAYLDTEPHARAKWNALVSRYRRETGREAEPR